MNQLADQALLARKTEFLGGLNKFERISILSESIQELKDGPYKDPDYKFAPLYEIGEEIVVCSEYYYFAKVRSIKRDFECPDLKKLIPAYEVVYRDWTSPELDREHVVEYDVLALSGPNYKPVEMFLAYEWNKNHPKHWAKLSKSKKRGIFMLDSANLGRIREEVNKQFSKAFPGTGVGDFRQWLNQG